MKFRLTSSTCTRTAPLELEHTLLEVECWQSWRLLLDALDPEAGRIGEAIVGIVEKLLR